MNSKEEDIPTKDDQSKDLKTYQKSSRRKLLPRQVKVSKQQATQESEGGGSKGFKSGGEPGKLGQNKEAVGLPRKELSEMEETDLAMDKYMDKRRNSQTMLKSIFGVEPSPLKASRQTFRFSSKGKEQADLTKAKKGDHPDNRRDSQTMLDSIFGSGSSPLKAPRQTFKFSSKDKEEAVLAKAKEGGHLDNRRESQELSEVGSGPPSPPKASGGSKFTFTSRRLQSQSGQNLHIPGLPSLRTSQPPGLNFSFPGRERSMDAEDKVENVKETEAESSSTRFSFNGSRSSHYSSAGLEQMLTKAPLSTQTPAANASNKQSIVVENGQIKGLGSNTVTTKESLVVTVFGKDNQQIVQGLDHAGAIQVAQFLFPQAEGQEVLGHQVSSACAASPGKIAAPSLKLRLCKKNDKYQVCPIAPCYWGVLRDKISRISAFSKESRGLQLLNTPLRSPNQQIPYRLSSQKPQ